MRLLPLTSSQIAAIGYDQSTRTLAVQFQRGGFYIYDDVPMDIFVEVITDEISQGRAFGMRVKAGMFSYRQATPEEVAAL